MHTYDIKYLPLFEEDLADIVDYIVVSLKNPDAARDLLDTIEQALLDRAKCPLSFEPFDSAKKRPMAYYRIYVKNFTIFYVVFESDRIMEVRRILYSKRNVLNIM
jgi:plasmid stabilization system protein ParE